MPSKDCYMDIAVKLIPFEPDGTECTACGDVIFLEGKRAIFINPVSAKKIGELDYRFCQACGEALESVMDEEEKEQW